MERGRRRHASAAATLGAGQTAAAAMPVGGNNSATAKEKETVLQVSHTAPQMSRLNKVGGGGAGMK